jgi:hypothetical protein
MYILMDTGLEPMPVLKVMLFVQLIINKTFCTIFMTERA